MIALALALVLAAVFGWVTACLLLGSHVLARWSMFACLAVALAVWVFLSPHALAMFVIGGLSGLVIRKGK